MQTGVNFAKREEIFALLEKWKDNIPGGNEHISGFQIRKALPPEYEGKVLLPSDDSSGEKTEREMHKASSEEMLIVFGNKIYPPARHSLMLLAEDPAVGPQYKLQYERGVAQASDYFLSKGKHYSKITAKDLPALQGKLEHHIAEYAIQDRVSGFLGQIYSALAITDSPNCEFSKYVFVQSKPANGELVLLGVDSQAIESIANKLNGIFGPEIGWNAVEHKHLVPNTAPELSDLQNIQESSQNNPREYIAIPVIFFKDREHMKMLEKLTESIVQPKAIGRATTY